MAVKRLYRLWAPHAQENPIFFHATDTSPKGFQLEIDQMAEVGFEMLIYSFGSGFNLETADPAYLATVKAQIAYAQGKGIEVGGCVVLLLLFFPRGGGPFCSSSSLLPHPTPPRPPLAPAQQWPRRRARASPRSRPALSRWVGPA